MAPAQSKALTAFLSAQQRALEMSQHHHELANHADGKHKCADDVLRAAIVLSVAAMDGYFTRRFSELLVPYLKRNGPNEKLIQLLEAAGLTTAVALELAAMDRPYRRVRALVQRHLATYTTQRFRAIDELFLALGVKDLSKHAQGMAKKTRLLRSVELLVERRHQIVHDGDMSTHGKLLPIDPKEIIKRQGDLLTYVGQADALISRAVKV